MRVRTTSWHYRLWRFGRENSESRPRDLCRYFWHLFLIKVLLPLWALVMVLYGVYSLLVAIWENPFTTAIVAIVVAIVGALAVGLFFWLRRVEERREARKETERSSPPAKKEPSVLREFLSARKRKVCPLIEVVNDKEVS